MPFYRSPRKILRVWIVLAAILMCGACADQRLPYSGPPVWEPLSQGQCDIKRGTREYSAALAGQSADACGGPANIVMGVTFTTPERCENSRGFWSVQDSSCGAAMPQLPMPGSSAVPDVPAEGFADLHNHLLAHVAFGESVFWGASFGEPKHALRPIPQALRKPHQRVEALASSRGLSGVFDSHAETGHPEYDAWPTPALKTHQQSHIDWLYRAYQGGLRLVVVHAVNNQDMFGRGENRMGSAMRLVASVFGSGAEPLPHRTSNDMEALEHQVRAAHELVAWVKAHRGDWLDIAQTPKQASDLIAAGKLALVLGSEVDHPLNCDLQRRCSQRHIREGLTKLEALGLAVIFPTHHKQTQFGDSANFQPLNSGPLRPCPGFKADCAAIGMTEKGKYLIREMMQRGLLVDLGHAGDRPFDDSLQLLEAEGYPALMSHASAHPMKPNGSAEYGLRLDQLQRLDALGGMVSLHAAKGEYPGAQNQGATIPYGGFNGGGGYVQSYLYALDALQGAYFDELTLTRGAQIAFAHDWNGFSSWPFGRFANNARPRARLEHTDSPITQPPRLQYPILLPSNLVPAASGATSSLEAMRFEGKTYDFNDSGLAQAGMTPDLLADMQLHGLSAAQLDPIYRSARGFIDMWQRARDATPKGDRGWLRWVPQSPTDLIEFEYLDTDRLIEVRPGVVVCRARGSGQVGSLIEGQCEPVEPAFAKLNAQPAAGEIRNANSGYCLTATTLAVNASLTQSICNDAPEQQWLPQWTAAANAPGQIRSASHDLCVAVTDGQPALAVCSEQTALRRVRIGNTYHLQSSVNRCLQVPDRSLETGIGIVVTACAQAGRADFHWEIDSLRDAFDYELLFSTRTLVKGGNWVPKQTPAPLQSARPYVVTDSGGAPLCRKNGQLGTVRKQQCITPGATGDNAHFEQLMAASPIGPLPPANTP